MVRGAKHYVEDASFAQRNFPSEKDEEVMLSRVLVDLGDKSESLTALQFDKNGKTEKAKKAGTEKEGCQRDKVRRHEHSTGRLMLALSLKRKKPEISTKLDEQPRVFSKSAGAGMSTQATIMIPDKKNLLVV